MQLLDFQFDFISNLEFEGDNETDVNCLRISRIVDDTCGNRGAGKGVEEYYLSTGALREIAIGLEAMAGKIREHLKQ